MIRKMFAKKEEGARTVLPGERAPDFNLPGADGSEISLSEFQGQPVIIAFYPKSFTTVCSSQLALYNEVLEMFQEFDAVLLGISVDNLADQKEYQNSLRLRFPLLSDADPLGEVSQKYGVFDNKHQLSQRALFVIDQQGITRWSYVSPPGVNPGADGILDALESLSKD